MAYRQRSKPAAKRSSIAPAPRYSSTALYGASAGSSTVAPKPTVMASERAEGWPKAEKVYYSLSAHDLKMTPKEEIPEAE